jgi:Sigma-70 region 2
MSMLSNRPHESDPLAPHRGRLLGLAYRMLGSSSDADDVVQDAYIRFAGAQDVHNPEAFLVTVVTRLCLDRRKSAALRADAVAVTDGGGRKTAALNPIMGADKVARFFIALAAKNAGRDIRVQPTMINGTVGALLYMDGEVDHTLSTAIDGDRIVAIYIVRNPDKLRHAPAREHH